MANTITRIVAYPQVLCYKKTYIDALLSGGYEEPTGANGQNFAAFFSPKVGGGIYYRKLNPYILDENMQSVVIANNINHELNDVPVEIDYSDVIGLFQTACADGQYYAHNTNPENPRANTSTAYKIMEYNTDDYLVPVNPNANVPLFLRYIYSVTYTIQGTEVTVNFPTTANTYFETVLNALNNWQFTPNQPAQRQKGANSITFYDEEGEVLGEVDFDQNNSITYNITSLPVYLGVEVALRGHRSAALNCFNDRYILIGQNSNIPLGTNPGAPAGSELSNALSGNWSVLGIGEIGIEPRAEPPFETFEFINNPTYKFSNTYKRLVAGKIDTQVNDNYFLAVENEGGGYSISTGMVASLSTTITVPSVSLVANVLTLSKDTMPTQTVAKIVNTLPSPITNVKRKFKLAYYATRAAGSNTDFGSRQPAPQSAETAFVDQDDIPAGETQMYDFSIENLGVEGTSAIEKMFNMFGMTTIGGTSTICSAVYSVKCIVQFDYLGVTYEKETPFTVFLGMAEDDGIKITLWTPEITGGKWSKTRYNLTVKTCNNSTFTSRSSFLISLKDHAIIFAQGERELQGQAIKDISLTSTGKFIAGAQCAFTNIDVVNHPNAIGGVISSLAKSRLTLKSPDGHKGSIEAVDIEGAWDDLSVSTNYTVTVPDEVETDDASEGFVSSGA
jgi:hypothetical protein